MRQLFKKIMVCFLAIQLAFFSPIAQSAGWSFGSFDFAKTELNIVKDGVRVVTNVESAPIINNTSARILGNIAGRANVLMAIASIVHYGWEAIEYITDPANNQVKWRPKTVSGQYYVFIGTERKAFSSGEAACSALLSYLLSKQPSYSLGSTYSGSTGSCLNSNGGTLAAVSYAVPENVYTPLPVSQVSESLYKNAIAGDVQAQADILPAIKQALEQGAFDKTINKAAESACPFSTHFNGSRCVADTDTSTDNSSIPIPSFDPSSLTSAIQSSTSIMSAMLQNLWKDVSGLKSVINTSIDKLLNKQEQMQGELVNVGSKVEGVGGQVVGVGDKVDNVGGKVVGVGDAVKDVGGKVVGLNDSVDKVGDKVVGVGDKVTAVGDKVGEKVDAVGDKVTAVGDKVGEKVDASTAANEKIAQKVDDLTKKVDTVGEKVEAAGDKVTDAIKEKKQEENQETQCPPMTIKVGEKCLDIPIPGLDEKMTCSYSDFTQKVCDFTDWAKSPFDEPNEDGKVNIEANSDLPSITTDKVKFDNQCPAPTPLDISISSLMINFHDELNYQPLCDFMTKLRPFVVGFGYVSGAFIVAGVGRKNG